MNSTTTEAPVPTLSLVDEIEDGSGIDAEASGIIAAASGAVAKLVGSIVKQAATLTELRLSLSIVWGFVVLHSRDEKGHIPWNLGNAPNVVTAIRKHIAGLVGEDGSPEILSGAVKQQYNRVTREAFMQTLVLQNLSVDDTKGLTFQPASVAWTRALKHLPEEIRNALPGNLGTAYAPVAAGTPAFNKAMAAMYKASGLSVPEVYGGTKGSGSGPGKDKQNQSLSRAVETLVAERSEKIGVEGGDSFASVADSIYRLCSAFSAAYMVAAEVTGRPEVDATIGKCAEILSATINPKRDAEMTEHVTALLYVPKK